MNSRKSSYDFLGFGVKGYRSFASADIASVGPFGKVHLITGQNNTGKSALANIAIRILPAIQWKGAVSTDRPLFTERDLPQGTQWEDGAHITLSLCFSRDSLLSKIDNRQNRHDNTKALLEKVFSSSLLSRGNEGVCWFDFDVPLLPPGNTQQLLSFNEKLANALAEEWDTSFNDVALDLTSSSSSIPQYNLERIISQFAPWESIPRVIKVEAIRHITDNSKSSRQEISSGEGLVKELRRLKMPTVEEQFINQKKWNRFEQFVRSVLNDPFAEITTDAEARVVQVKSGTSGLLELSELGTGIEELIIIAAVVACNENKLIFIEEPEIHLHPTLQSKLVQYFLDDENGNRFLITTHSPSIINVPGVTITQVSKIRNVSTALQIRGVVDARRVLDDIGARPSDLLQSNYVIWVEGPSDRIYVNYWLSIVSPELVEGTHYSVMIYGGKLLNACNADVINENDELISLFRINTHFCVLMDSDRPKKGSRLNRTKLRIKDECKSSGNMSWVTDGRTIENYVPGEILRDVIDELYPEKTYKRKMNNQYICPLGGKFEGLSYGPDKIKVAHKVVEIGYELPLNLRKQVEKLVTKIREANGLSETAT